MGIRWRRLNERVIHSGTFGLVANSQRLLDAILGEAAPALDLNVVPRDVEQKM